MRLPILFLIFSFLSLNLKAQNICNIPAFQYEIAQTVNGSFYFIVNEPANILDDYLVFINGDIQGINETSEVNLAFGPYPADCETFYHVYIENRDNPECNISINLGRFCAISPSCSFAGLKYDILDCTNSELKIQLDFIPGSEQNEGFILFAENGNELGSFSYDQLPVYFSYPNSSSGHGYIFIQDKENPNCAEEIEFVIDCDPNECKIYEMDFAFPECDPNGQVMIHLDFKYQNVGDLFNIIGNNGEFFGTFPYEALPVEFGPVPSDCNTPFEFYIQDLESDFCAEKSGEFIICCPDICSEPKFEIVDLDCNDQRIYLKLQLEQTNPVNLYYILLNNLLITDFEIDYPFIYLEIPATTIALVNNLSVCTGIAGDIECCYTQTFTLEDCYGDECKLYNMTVTPEDCDLTNVPYVKIDFDHKNTGEEGFIIRGNGIEYGIFQYDELPVKIPVDRYCDRLYEFIAMDLQYDDCYAEAVLDPFCCNFECSFRARDIDLKCDSLGLQGISFYLEEDTDGIKEYKIYINNELIDITEENNTVLEYEVYFPLSSGEALELTICDSDCCWSEFLLIEDCFSHDCKIFDIETEIFDCTGSDLPYFKLDFEYQNTASDGFLLISNGQVYGQYSYSDLPIQVPLFPDCEMVYEFKIQDWANSECNAFFELGPVCCDSCSFSIEDVEIRCEDGVLLAIGFYLFEETDPIKTYKVFLNGELIGETQTNNEFVFFEFEKPIDPDLQYELEVCSEDCCIRKILNLSECLEQNCVIKNIQSYDLSCLNGSLSFTLDFEYQGTGNLGFDLYSLQGYHGFYKYEDLPIRIEDFPVIDSPINFLFICDNDSFCCSAHIFEHPACLSLVSDVHTNPIAQASSKYVQNNPANWEILLKSPVEHNQYMLFNSKGQFITQIKVKEFETTLPISDLENGLYFIRIFNERETKTEKIIISR